MAIYHMSVKPVQRSKGRSSTAAAAYRAAEKIYDERTGLTHDYTKKDGVVHTQIITPDGVNIPNRAALWNMAEAAERRKDGCTAREYEVNLPHELTAQQRTELAQDFCRQLAKTHGIAVDLCIHKPTAKEIKAGSDPRNHHAHIMTTTRKITNDGLTDKADIEKSGRKRKDDLNATRELWADTVNKHLAAANINDRVSHLSHAERGLDATPTIKLGKVDSEMERQDIETIKGDINRNIRADNAELVRLADKIAAYQKILDATAAEEAKAQEAKAAQARETSSSRRANFTFGAGAKPAPARKVEPAATVEYAPAPAPKPRPKVEPEPIEYKSLRLANDSDTNRYRNLMHMHDDAVKTPQNEYFARFIGEKMTKIDFQIEQFRQGLSRNMSSATSQQQEDMQSAFSEVNKWRSNIDDYKNAYHEDKAQARAELEPAPAAAPAATPTREPTPPRDYDSPSP